MDTQHLLIIVTGWLLAALSALGLVGIIWIIGRDLRVGAVLVTGLFLSQAIFLHLPGVSLGVTIYPADVIFLLLAAGAFLNLLTRDLNDKLLWVWLAFGLLLLSSFLRGVPHYKTMAGVEFRQYFYIWSGMLYFYCSPVSKEQIRFLLRVALWAGIAITMVVFYRWLSDAVGWGPHHWLESGHYSRFRVVKAETAYVLCQLLLIGTYALLAPTVKRGHLVIGLSILSLEITVLEHRTVWVTTLVSLILLFLLSSSIRNRVVNYVGYILLFSLVAALPIEFFSGLGHTFYYKALVEPFRYNSTFAWRVDTWQANIHQLIDAGPTRWLVGFPFGHGYHHYVPIQHAYSDAYPHDFYISLLTRTGIVGLALVAFTYGLLAIRLFRIRRREQWSGEPLHADLLFVLLASQLIFGITYNPNYIEALFLGIIAQLAWNGITPHSYATPYRRYAIS